ncbi:MAG: rRNA maturation RNase YbeY [Verrucomicrobia bacterium]|nr:rRNA maturation RNase YbeY [Verrucomicrobiota bacterium]
MKSTRPAGTRLPVRIAIGNRQRAVAIESELLRHIGKRALSLCLPHPGPEKPLLPELERVDVWIVSDRRSAALHERFFNLAGPTDVITFQHGEIVIASGVAVRQARAHRQPLWRELARYLVHGLLHLHGYTDAQPAQAAAMWRVQERLLRAALRGLPKPAVG